MDTERLTRYDRNRDISAIQFREATGVVVNKLWARSLRYSQLDKGKRNVFIPQREEKE
jgi:hypothetical protein